MAAGVALGACVCAAPAQAQDIAAAESLFREGRQLFDQGDYAAACVKLSESERLDASSGTLLNLAACHAKLDKTALAWAEFLAAARLAKAQGRPERAEEAARRAAELELALSYLTIVVTRPVPGLEVTRDDTLLEANSLGSKIPIDPGEHALTIRAPGYETLTLNVKIGERADSQTVTVPALAKAALKTGASEAQHAASPPLAQPAEAGAKTPPPVPNPRTPHDGNRRTLGFAVGGAGVAALAVGGVFGVLAISAYHQADHDCPSHRGCSDGVLQLSDTASSRATIANVGVGVGIAGIAAGVALILLSPRAAPSEGPAQTSVRLVLAPQVAGVACAGAF
ncbi:MAG TPA: hypothetical protein VGM44_17150 [Polyangiaceae bacterium]